METEISIIKEIFFFLISERMFNLYGAFIGSSLAFAGAYYIFQKQRKEDKEIENKRNQPILVVSHSEFETSNFKLGYDLVDADIPLKNNSKFSCIKLPFINAGKTPVYDIRYYYEIENLKELNDVLNSKAPAKATFLSNSHENDTFSFFYADKQNLVRPRFSIKKYYKMISVLMPSEVNEIVIPTFVAAMWNYELFIFSKHPRYNDHESFSPVISLTVIYRDYKNIERELKYDLTIQNKHAANSVYGYFVDFEIVTTKIHDIELKKKPSSN
ncbi:hypothetical protein [Marinilactibacillus kalidii]|uniref:hypothetical protein n=1 Tax=Marinilactibacillus kalidii TaxID=2820274 RepID=UPI001ABDCA26|nr:hypothetical protein [Marinilactibacillus kalidii]